MSHRPLGLAIKPRDKAKVEQSVLLVERWVLARLRNQRFFSQAELTLAIAELVAELNGRVMRAFGASRAELLFAVDAPAPKPLPPEPYAFATWKRCRVALDYHVEVDGCWYSVPYRLIGELVDVRIADRTIEAFLEAKPEPHPLRHGNIRGRSYFHRPNATKCSSTPPMIG